MFQKFLSDLKILGAGKVTLGNFCSGYPQILEATVTTLSPFYMKSYVSNQEETLEIPGLEPGGGGCWWIFAAYAVTAVLYQNL
jgi:hypothetical protein